MKPNTRLPHGTLDPTQTHTLKPHNLTVVAFKNRTQNLKTPPSTQTVPYRSINHLRRTTLHTAKTTATPVIHLFPLLHFPLPLCIDLVLVRGVPFARVYGHGGWLRLRGYEFFFLFRGEVCLWRGRGAVGVGVVGGGIGEPAHGLDGVWMGFGWVGD